MLTQEQNAGYSCIKLSNGAVTLWITRDVGPRIIGLALNGGDNLLAVTPHAHAITPAGRIYHFRGGHRFWVAPEHAETTYEPDDAPVTIEEIERGVRTLQPLQNQTGLEKRMAITLPDGSATIVIDHTVVNRGADPLELAPWGITQLRPGGFAILPQATDATGLLPNRRLAFWPYSRLKSPYLHIGDRFIFVEARMKDEMFKVGWANPAGWQSYWKDGTLFVKQAIYDPDATYFDFGSSCECYCDDRFLELETIGPRTFLAPEAAVTHRETWRLFGDVALEMTEETIVEFVSKNIATD